MSEKDDTPCPYVTGNVTRYCTLTPLALTDEEREAVERAADLIDAKTCGDSATLRGLLERTQPGS